MLPMVSVALPVFVKVTLCEVLSVPTVWVPNDRLVAESEATGLPDTPVPLSETLCGEFDALSVMVMAAVSGPVVVGAKCPWMVQFAPAARVVPQLFANPNEEAPAPVTAMLEMVKVAESLFVNVTLCDGLKVPTL
jgi:hypothetical protein